jgi:hypothetical protein
VIAGMNRVIDKHLLFSDLLLVVRRQGGVVQFFAVAGKDEYNRVPDTFSSVSSAR